MRTPARLKLILSALTCVLWASPAVAEIPPDRSVALVDPIEAIFPGGLK